MDNLDEFIRQNAEFLTIPDMAEETGLSQQVIRTRCNALNVTPVKLRDQAKQFVRDHCHSKTPSEISKFGGYRMTYLVGIYKELRIPFRRILYTIHWGEDGNALPAVPLGEAEFEKGDTAQGGEPVPDWLSSLLK